MCDRTPIPLKAVQIELDSTEFQEICGWQFQEDYVRRLLREDIPQRKEDWETQIWTFRDPTGELVGFGTIEVCDEYDRETERRTHPYIPLLAVKPSRERRGHGTQIVRHLISEAVILMHNRGCHDVLFLDVYEDKLDAIHLYEKPECGFRKLPGKPIPDDRENGRTFIIMTKSLTIAQA